MLSGMILGLLSESNFFTEMTACVSLLVFFSFRVLLEGWGGGLPVFFGLLRIQSVSIKYFFSRIIKSSIRRNHFFCFVDSD